MISESVNSTRSDGIKYELTEAEVLNLYYSEPRLAALIDLDIIKLIDRHLVVNLKQFITPKTYHLTANARRHLPSCCVGIQYVSEESSMSFRAVFPDH